MKRSAGELGSMTNAELVASIERSREAMERNNDALIEAGMGDWRYSDVLRHAGTGNALCCEAVAIMEAREALQREGELRYGPRFSGWLPRGGARVSMGETIITTTIGELLAALR